MPESVKDRCAKSHEYLFLLSKSRKYYFDYRAIQEKVEFDGRKDTIMKGAPKYKEQSRMAFAHKGHERWRFKDNMAIRNKRSVWTVPTAPFEDVHFATFPGKLIAGCILAGCPENGAVLDPFMGSGTTAVIARKLNRNYLGFELNPDYVKMAEKRLKTELGLFV
jgi:DNA modification methylase